MAKKNQPSLVANAVYLIKELLRTNPNKKPQKKLPVMKVEPAKINRSVDQVIWLGHSASLIILNKQLILVDPMLGKYASPVPGLYRRFNSEPLIDLESFEKIDVMIFSHNHYDHLDKQTVLTLNQKTSQFLVPIGMSRNLEKWGIDKGKIVEVANFQEIKIAETTFIGTPAKHYSGRGLFDKNKSQCLSWVLKTESSNLFFSGDSAYDAHFKEIGQAYGPFDLVLMECGQYDAQWPTSHMFPEQSVQAVSDVQGHQFIPIHWGGYALGFHPWSEPIERALVAAEEHQLTVITPMIGQSMPIHQVEVTRKWWRGLDDSSYK